MLRILLCLLFFAQTGFAQSFTSTIRGTVQDADTKSPLAGATVSLISPQTGTITDAQGAFRFDNLPTGRYQLSVSYVGYETVRIPELLLESGKENVQQIRLAPAGKQLNEATVTGARPVAFNSVQEITIEQTLRYAATYMDPARVATSFAGVAAANDQANGLVIRGNSPNSMQWRLEGVEIVNPNHLSNAGTFSDRPTSTGGGVNILSTQLLGTSQFLSGPFPAQYGNVNGGILDMHLRNGNDQKTEFTAQASLLGLDFAAEGPFSKKSKASYLVNYRYSFTGLLGALGVKFGGEDIRFQDLSFHVNLPTVKAGTFTVFGMGGVSSNDFKSEGDSTTWETQKDGYNIIYKNKMGAIGVTNDLPLGRNASLRTVVAASGLRTSRDAAPVFDTPSTPADGNGEDLIKKRMVSVSSVLNARFGTRSRMRAGGYLTWQKDILTRYYGGVGSYIVQPFASWNYQITSSVTTEIGLHSLISKLDLPLSKTNISVEPRASLKWQVNEKEQFNFSYGLHSQMQQPQTYLAAYSTTDAWGNPGLTPSKSHHFVVGYQRSFAKNASLKVEAYWQEHFNIPVAVYEEDHFSALNLIENDVTKRLENNGTGRNYGVEVSYQKLLTDNYYMLLSGSLYDATYVAKDGVRRDSRFNGRHTFSFTGGKEFKSGDRSTWGVNAKILWLGGFRDTPINLAASREFQQTVYLQNEDFSYKMKDYFRPDLRIYWKKSNAKYSRTLALDLQNVSGTKNQAFKFYDTLKKEIITQTQLGLIPVLSYRWEF